jgi:hypothetical protein
MGVIVSLDADGFTVFSNVSPEGYNQDGMTYWYLAIR